MALIRSTLSQYAADITITQDRYNELILAEREAEILKNLIHNKASTYSQLVFEELRLIDKLFYTPVEEAVEEEELEDDDG